MVFRHYFFEVTQKAPVREYRLLHTKYGERSYIPELRNCGKLISRLQIRQ